MNRLPVFLLGLVAVACGSTDSPAADAFPGPDADPDSSFSTTASRVAIVEATYRGQDQTITISRAFAQLLGPAVGPTMFHTETLRDGACRMLEFEPGLCEPFCDGICKSDDTCVPFPTYTSAGTISLTGLELPVTLVADPSFAYYNSRPELLPANVFTAGADISASAPGGQYPAFSLTARAVPELPVDSLPAVLDLKNNQDLGINWQPAGGGARVRLTLNSTSAGGHGSPLKAIIECDAPDTGQLTVPRSLIDAFPEAFGGDACVLIDCPSSRFERYGAATATAGAGTVELWIASAIEFGVRH